MARLRVVLLDGLGRDHADTLSGLGEACERGTKLAIDVGFPTVSLPVQHVLWTGLTQQQSGVGYRIAAFDRPPRGALPAMVDDSVAIAESHPEIVGSFGFGRVTVTGEGGTPESGSEAEFVAAALDGVRSDASLVFVHVLRIDAAGHGEGGGSAAYAEAAQWSDELLGRLIAADPEARWVVLADHGHRVAGGHGGAEPEIRTVRGCVFGAGVAPEPSRDVHLVDVSRLLFRSLGRPLGDGVHGMPWSIASARSGASLPGPGSGRLAVAGLLWLAGLGLTWRMSGRRIVEWPLWWIATAMVMVAVTGWPSLSNPIVYPPLGRDMHLLALPGYVGLVITVWFGARRDRWWRVVVSQLVLPVTTVMALAMACGGIEHLVDGGGTSMLVPRYTAATSMALVALAGGLVAAALGLAVGVLVRRPTPSTSP